MAEVQDFFGWNTSYLKKDFRIRVRADIVQSLVGSVEDADVLDVGCGDGSISRPFLGRGNRLTLVDKSPTMLERARRGVPAACSGMTCVQADFRQWQFEDSFDLGLCMGVLAHMPSVDSTLQRIATPLKPGGRCVLQLTDHQRVSSKVLALYRTWVGKCHGGYGYSINRTRLENIDRSMAQNGLVRTAIRRYSLLLPLMGCLPNGWLYRYEHLILKNKALAWIATDVVAVYGRVRGGEDSC